MQDLKSIHPRLELKISPRARRLALRLDSKRQIVNLVVPKRASLRKAYDFARQHTSWIEEKITALPPPIILTDGLVVSVLGRDRTIRIVRPDGLKRTTITMRDDAILIETNKDDPSPRLIRFLKEQIKEKLTELSCEKAAKIGKTIKSVSVRDTRSRWGSCAKDGNLSYSWRLAFAPTEAIDYLAAHEVAHLEHMNHGSKFWALCEELSADYKAGKTWMAEHGHNLMRYSAAASI